MSLELLRALTAFVLQGSDSNWWGLGCPSHCRGPGIGSLVAAYLLGVLSVLGWLLLRPGQARLRLLAPEDRPQVTRTLSSGARRRLAEYAHGQ